ncbi:cilia- and flagella-associated protein 61-like [Trichoplusia ni]|uniref:Cilia- and flagella-associated protein 61-like n=1 Tax=Trichoplusia ni TaxID=7111 RepID=A0A7E5VQ50_TRINI|nr:cilia- and flagella-associated protein 61-like [Trichoplusia ni]
MATRVVKPPPLGKIRLASPKDAPDILVLLSDSISLNFRVKCTFDITYLIENCVLALCQLDPQGAIIGFLAARDYPLVPAVHPSAWEEYVWAKYKVPEMNARNTLFLHLLCWNPAYGRETVDSMLKSVFMNDQYLLHIAMIKSLMSHSQLIPGHARSEASFRRVTAAERGMNSDQLPVLCIADRSEVCPRLRIRRAVEEDNDDLVPIIEQHSDRLRQMYGEFYISELISRHPESERVLLVCEHSELAVGMMCLNTQINYQSLEESFVLSPFGGLRHLQGSQLPKFPAKEVESAYSLLAEPHYTDSFFKQQQDMKSRVTWVFEADEFNEFRSVGASTSANQKKVAEPFEKELHKAQLEILELFDDEEEEAFEFDIVNIDNFLLRVPEMLTLDTERGPAHNIMNIISGRKDSSIPEGGRRERSKSSRMSGGAGAAFKMPEPIRYSGTPNAFLLELFAIHPNYDERYGYDMLETAFEMFPDRDYCIMCLPSNHPPFPLLEHFTLVTPFGSSMRYINETLYVAHVNSVKGKLSVRPGEAVDTIALNDVLEHAPRIETLLALFKSTLKSYTLQSFILLSENQPIGLIIIGPLEDGTAIRMQYDLEPEARRTGTDGTILAGVMSPAFLPHSRWYMREMLRHSRYSTLFWICRLFAKGDACPTRNLMSLAGYMSPVHPRHTVPNISGNKDLNKIFADLASPFALWVLERPLTSMPKVFVNVNIVVVGASRTGLAFLETLLMGPTSQYLTFCNVTLVSEHGLPTVVDCLKAADICVPRDGRYTDRYIKSVPFFYYVDIISAVMIKIDRKRKCIQFGGGGTKYYDELVLTCGQQFQHPDYLKEALGLAKEVAKGKPCDRLLMDNPKNSMDSVPIPPETPENVFLINSLFEANICLKKLLRMISNPKEYGGPMSKENRVVVYGDCVEAYSSIAALLELGISAEMIVFVEPFPSIEEPAPLRVNCFNDEMIDERVQASVERLGIHTIRKCHLAAWHQVGNRVESLDFMTPLTAISLKSFALFYYGIQAINLHAFKAINESGLVYDGGLVVSPTFETNDPCIYGAGTCVRYSRRLYATRRLHRDYCSEDIGEALATLFLQKMDPFVMGDPERRAASDLLPRFSSTSLGFRSSLNNISVSSRPSTTSIYRRWQPVMKFESPIVQSATLPGPLYYMKLRKPGKETPMAVQQLLPRQGHTLITDKRDNLFKLQLNVRHQVDAVTCLSHKPFSTEILSQLYGKHEAFFGKLYTRFQKKQIDDFYDFFTRPWMSALYQETFTDLVDDINHQDIGTIYDLVKSKFALFDQDAGATKSNPLMKVPSDALIDSSASYMKEPRQVGTFREVIERFLATQSGIKFDAQHPTDMPTECGQGQAIRKEASEFWKHVDGERIVMAHLARYLETHAVTNPHFAIPKPECT